MSQKTGKIRKYDQKSSIDYTFWTKQWDNGVRCYVGKIVGEGRARK